MLIGTLFVRVALPLLNEQERISEIINTHNNLIRTEEVYREKLKLLKQGLMHDLLTGKVRVNTSQKIEDKSALARLTKA